MGRFRLQLGDSALELGDGEHDIGRNPDCWLVVSDDLASRRHARLIVGDGRLSIADLDSRNGTFVNEERIAATVDLSAGDQVRIGRASFEVQVVGSDNHATRRGRRVTLTAHSPDTGFPNLLGMLVERSLQAGNYKGASQYALVAVQQLAEAKLDASHPSVVSCSRSLLELARTTADGTWIDRLFGLFTQHAWIMDARLVDQVRCALDRITWIPGRNIGAYERRLVQLTRAGHHVPTSLSRAVAEWADGYT